MTFLEWLFPRWACRRKISRALLLRLLDELQIGTPSDPYDRRMLQFIDELRSGQDASHDEDDPAAMLAELEAELGRVIGNQVLHPYGSCTCCGEGDCGWCVRSESLARAEKAEARISVLEAELEDAINVLQYPEAYGPAGILVRINHMRSVLERHA